MGGDRLGFSSGRGNRIGGFEGGWRAPDTAEIIYFTNLDNIKVATGPLHFCRHPSPICSASE